MTKANRRTQELRKYKEYNDGITVTDKMASEYLINNLSLSEK